MTRNSQTIPCRESSSTRRSERALQPNAAPGQPNTRKTLQRVSGILAATTLLAGLWFAAGLAASQRNGQIVRTSGPDPRHVCHEHSQESAGDAQTGGATRHHIPGDETLQRLQRETRELMVQIGAGHQKLMRLSPSLTPERHVFVLKDMAYGLDERSEMVGERTVVAIRYDAAQEGETPQCVILDHTLRNHDEPGRWIRRIVRLRVSEQNQLNVRFETIGHNLHATLGLDELEAPARLRISRRILGQLRDVRYVIDRTLPALTARAKISPF